MREILVNLVTRKFNIRKFILNAVKKLLEYCLEYCPQCAKTEQN